MMNCPRCNSKMAEGTATVQGTFFGFLLFGLSHQHLWFIDRKGEKRKVVMSNETVRAFRCKDCGLVVLNDKTIIEEKASEFGKKLAEKSLK